MPGHAALVLRDSPSCVPLPGVVAGLASVDVCHNAGQCSAGERFALLAVVADFLRVVSTYNRQQWHTHCLGMPLAIDKLTITAHEEPHARAQLLLTYESVRNAARATYRLVPQYRLVECHDRDQP